MLQKPMALSLRLAFFLLVYLTAFFVEEGMSIGNSEKFVYKWRGY